MSRLVLRLVARQIFFAEDEMIIDVGFEDIEIVFARQRLVLGTLIGKKHSQLGLSICQHSNLTIRSEMHTFALPSGFCSVQVRKVPIRISSSSPNRSVSLIQASHM